MIASSPSSNPETAVYDTDTDRWTAVANRDRNADGHFVYGVSTTGVYCRPWCASRLPSRKNVAFFRTSSEARDAGFRGCRRCDPAGESPLRRRAEVIARAIRSIEASRKAPSLAELAREAGMSPSHFRRSFEAATGLSPKRYSSAVAGGRIRRALDSEPSVSSAVFAAGYEAPSRFYAEAHRRLGMSPGAYRRGGPGEVLRIAVAESSLGTVLVAATDRGVCAVELGSDPEHLLSAFQDRYPAARVIGGDSAFESVVARVITAVEDPGAVPELPLDIRGTAFQETVWATLRAIPAGETRTYSEVAEAIGRPKAARAVAGACASNEIGVLVPCHRVVRTDGGLGGYRWGIERKARLLRRERDRTA